jgi:hypothetical protein
MDGAERDEIAIEFVTWIITSGHLEKICQLGGSSLISEADIESGLTREQAIRAWEGISSSSELDAAIFQFTALNRAVSEARTRGLRPERRDYVLAELELVTAHSAATWGELLGRFAELPQLSRRLVEHREMLATAKRLRRRLFCVGTGGPGTKEGLAWRRS